MPLVIINAVIGWIYFVAWSVSFYPQVRILINNDLVQHIQAKTKDRRVLRFGNILAPLSRETKMKYAISRLTESSVSLICIS